jgi:hypothetical protein
MTASRIEMGAGERPVRMGDEPILWQKPQKRVHSRCGRTMSHIKSQNNRPAAAIRHQG